MTPHHLFESAPGRSYEALLAGHLASMNTGDKAHLDGARDYIGMKR